MKLNLGCPEYCPDYLCVDTAPKDSDVIKSDALEYMRQCLPDSVSGIRAFNLIEHLPNIGLFFELAHRCLMPGAELVIRTDNAEWPLFYLNLPKGFLGLGAHASTKYRYLFSNGSAPHDGNIQHFAVFTKLHLHEYARLYGFKIVKLDRVAFGARLLCRMRKSI